ncbi:hypothetical protein BDV93DRAFT_168675 [Ceratobasidium sp. AG-I]|nr:hypothetical protein BDV93DRAFT_168675 [Ceratobasidium sp. AG-I]
MRGRCKRRTVISVFTCIQPVSMFCCGNNLVRLRHASYVIHIKFQSSTPVATFRVFRLLTGPPARQLGLLWRTICGLIYVKDRSARFADILAEQCVTFLSTPQICFIIVNKNPLYDVFVRLFCQRWRKS